MNFEDFIDSQFFEMVALAGNFSKLAVVSNKKCSCAHFLISHSVLHILNMYYDLSIYLTFLVMHRSNDKLQFDIQSDVSLIHSMRECIKQCIVCIKFKLFNCRASSKKKKEKERKNPSGTTCRDKCELLSAPKVGWNSKYLLLSDVVLSNYNKHHWINLLKQKPDDSPTTDHNTVFTVILQRVAPVMWYKDHSVRLLILAARLCGSIKVPQFTRTEENRNHRHVFGDKPNMTQWKKLKKKKKIPTRF